MTTRVCAACLTPGCYEGTWRCPMAEDAGVADCLCEWPPALAATQPVVIHSDCEVHKDA